MLCVCRVELQVRQCVVLRILILVMDNLGRIKIATKVCFHRQSVLSHVARLRRERVIWSVDHHVTVSIHEPASIPVAIPLPRRSALVAFQPQLLHTAANSLRAYAEFGTDLTGPQTPFMQATNLSRVHLNASGRTTAPIHLSARTHCCPTLSQVTANRRRRSVVALTELYRVPALLV